MAGRDEAREEPVRWRVLFSGKVQHVGFRYSAYYLARELRLSGWVDNLPDGRVAMEVQGGVCRVRKLLLRLKAQRHIRITGMDIQPLALKRFERRFEVRGYERGET